MLTAAAAATLLGLSARKVYAMAAEGILPCYRFGSAVRFDPADLEAYRAAHQSAAKPPHSPRVLRTHLKLCREAGTEPGLTGAEMALAEKRHRNMRRAPWADRHAIAAIYAKAKALTAETGIEHQVDHVIPLQGDFVSGLRVENNLQILPAVDNIKKRNRFDPC
jgi:excisionase family DNA binding protein